MQSAMDAPSVPIDACASSQASISKSGCASNGAGGGEAKPACCNAPPATAAPSEADCASTSCCSAPPAAAATPPPPPRARRRRARIRRQIPDEITQDPLLKSAVSRTLPVNYKFEVPKTIWRCREANAQCVALQFPEGLLIYANALADIVREFARCERVVVLADVTYGACCVDDLTAKALGADFLVHYGHSCLVPSTITGPLKSLYVFVEIAFDVDHLVGCVAAEFLQKRLGDGRETASVKRTLALAGTIQFATGVERARAQLSEMDEDVMVPQQLPLSAGEVLGCTSPRLPENIDALVFVADGRFHLESLMIRNPHVPAFRYDPYSKRLTRETYDTRQLHRLRRRAVAAASKATRVGLVLGALGRQGSPAILKRVRTLLATKGIAHFCLILTEVTPDTLKRFDQHVDAWVQVACPRLSVDWGHHFSKPTLSPYEAFVAFGGEAWDDGHYPMDYYARSEKPWTNYFKGDAGVAAPAA